MSFYDQSVCAEHLDLTEGQFKCDLWVNQIYARVLLDSESMVTCLGTRVAARTLGVVCIHRDPREFSLLSVILTTVCVTITQKIGLVPDLIHSVIIGRDCPLTV